MMSKERLEEAKLMSLWERGRQNADVADMLGWLVAEVERLQEWEREFREASSAANKAAVKAVRQQRTKGQHGRSQRS